MTDPVDIQLIDVTADNVADYGFFCYKSKKGTPGYQRKLDWLQARFAEGMRLKLVHDGRTAIGFAEYMPGDAAWRAVQAPGYMLIHCLWVVGRNKKKGYGQQLLTACLADARAAGLHGVATIASRRNWLADTRFFVKHGFEPIASLDPSFDLVAYRFNADTAPPTFPADWAARRARLGPGLTVVYGDQCPYVADALDAALAAAAEVGVPGRAVRLDSGAQLQQEAPSPFGIFDLVYEGELLAYGPSLQKDVVKLLQARLQ